MRSVLRISQRNEPSDLDPATAPLWDEFFIIRALNEGLVFPSMPGEPALSRPTPAAAASWTTSGDGLTWTFHLRPDAKWSNGDPVTAADFVASYRRELTPATAAPRAELFYPVKNARAFVTGELKDFSAVGFSAPDRFTLVVTLERPLPILPEYAASGPWIPANPRVVAQYGRDWTRPDHYVSNGPYLLKTWSAHRRIVVARNPSYHDASAVKLDEIQFIRFDDGDTEDRAFRAGEIDVTMTVPVDRVAVYRRERSPDLHRQPLQETRYLSFNTARRPLDHPEVRRALSLAIDRRALVSEVLRGGQIPADGGFDPGEAKRLLAASGFPGGRGFPHLEMTGWGGGAGDRVLEAIQQMWRNTLGIDVAVATREARVHTAQLQSSQYDIGLMPLIPWVRDPAAEMATFTSAAAGNYPHWHNPIYDRLVAEGRLAEAARLFEQESPGAPLYTNVHNWLMRPYVHGWHEDGMWQRYYLLLWLDPRHASR